MEELGVTAPGRVTSSFWRGKRVLVTGHTGFKGSWLSLWLHSMGADVHGLSLPPPTSPSLYVDARVDEVVRSSLGDVREPAVVQQVMATARPEIVIHMAAQSLVRLSYSDPVGTYATNIMGTVNVLEAIRQNPSVRCVVSVTSDKCYENDDRPHGYREGDPMGGRDPYSNSKGCAELVTSAYRRSFLQEVGVAVASGRAGNVIGGGDWAVDRLVPDVLRAFEHGEPVVIRNPHATRPWQHVLEPLSGYLVLVERLWVGGQAYSEGWNFGPCDDDIRSVQWVVERMAAAWGQGAAWRPDGERHPHEAKNLKLDISKARSRLAWHPQWALDVALRRTVEWHQAWLSGKSARREALAQIADYMKGGADPLTGVDGVSVRR